MVTGEKIAAIAMTEPGAGSDLASIQTRAKKVSDGYVINGGKVFITNGQNADIVLVVARTAEDRYRGLSLLVVERNMEGFNRGRNLDKIGIHAQDTSELFFDDVHVPADNLLGEENKGFFYLVDNLPRERLSVAVGAVAAAPTATEVTTEYVINRRAYGKSKNKTRAPVGATSTSRRWLMRARMRSAYRPVAEQRRKGWAR